MNKHSITINEYARFILEPNQKNEAMLELITNLNRQLDIHKVIETAKTELSELNYNFLVNSSKDTITKLISLYSEYQNLKTMEEEELGVFNEHSEQSSREYLNATDAEQLGNELKKELTTNKYKRRRDGQSKRPKVKEGEEGIDENTATNEDGNKKE